MIILRKIFESIEVAESTIRQPQQQSLDTLLDHWEKLWHEAGIISIAISFGMESSN